MSRTDEPDTARETLADDAPSGESSLVVAGYELQATIGRGGMGEVVAAQDPRIGREVAIKTLRGGAANPELVERFLREAKIQGRLDHPAIVPVHEIGLDAHGQPYFTMKRLRGETLADVLARGDAPLSRLLRVFVDVCLAIEFAHERRFVHRDIKPTNIMLGRHGEVYVLDWGVARSLGDASAPDGASDIPTLEGHTQAGALLGTPGFMAPEQIRAAAEVGTAADVYALGAILFDILAGEPLHPRGTIALANTISQPTHVPAERRPDRAIAPELDDACRDALAADPEARPSAGELAQRVQRYLDGDRDLERRRQLAAEHLAGARAAARDPARHAEALRSAGRALALDPASREIVDVMSGLMLAPLAEPQPEIEAHLRAADRAYQQRAGRLGIAAMCGYFLLAPLLWWSGVIAPWLVGATYVGLVALTAVTWRFATSRTAGPLIFALVGNLAVAAVLSRLLSPFVFTPAVIMVTAVALGAQPPMLGRARLVLGCSLAAFLAPIALEATGVLAPTWSFERGALVVTSRMLRLTPHATTVLLVLGFSLAIALAAGVSHQLAYVRRDTQRELEQHAWRLRQLLGGVPVPRKSTNPVATL
jgi:serine/threonine-protein kinase